MPRFEPDSELKKREILKKLNQRQLKPKTLEFFPTMETSCERQFHYHILEMLNLILKPEEVTIMSPFWIHLLQGLKINT